MDMLFMSVIIKIEGLQPTMVTKQIAQDMVKDQVQKGVEKIVNSAHLEASQTGAKNLFIKVDTFNEEGREIGTRIVDMYHFGTRNWLQNHLWWAMHNKATVESQVADQKDIDIYLMESKKALAEKFNAHVAA